MGLFQEIRAFSLFFPDIQQSYGGLIRLENVLIIDLGHCRVLQKLGGLGVYIGPHIYY